MNGSATQSKLKASPVGLFGTHSHVMSEVSAVLDTLSYGKAIVESYGTGLNSPWCCNVAIS